MNRKHLYETLIQLLEYKAVKNAPQSHVTHLLGFLRSMPYTPSGLKKNLPKDYSSMLSALQQEFNFPKEEHIDYKICDCGFIWRGTWKWQKDTNRPCPTPGCQCREQDASLFHYRPLCEWVKHMYNNRDLAKILGSWEQRRRQDGSAADVYDGMYYSQLCQDGQLPNGDPR